MRFGEVGVRGDRGQRLLRPKLREGCGWERKVFGGLNRRNGGWPSLVGWVATHWYPRLVGRGWMSVGNAATLNLALRLIG